MYQIFIHGPHSPGVQGKFPKAKFKTYAQGPSGTITLTPLTPGTYTIYCRCIYVGTGLASAWVSDSAVVT
jgi:hypothetical protein